MAILEPMLMLIFSGDGDAGWASGSYMEAEEGSVQEETTKSGSLWRVGFTQLLLALQFSAFLPVLCIRLSHSI